MIALVVAMLASTYTGAVVFGGSMETKYTKIIEEEALAANLLPSHVIELGEKGEYAGFAIAGAIGGLLMGYLWPSIFEGGAVIPWLSRDPLVGILTTVSFFTFLVIGRRIRKRRL